MRTKNRLWLIWFSLLLPVIVLGAACNQDDDDDDNDDNDDHNDDDDDDDGYPIDEVTVEWFDCSLYEGADDGLAQCASTQMPLYWEDPARGAFTSYAKRLLSSSSQSEGQLWLLHGGPGASGVHDFPSYMEYIQDVYPELDLYTLDPRGTGYSEHVSCPDQESYSSDQGANISPAELDDCLDYLEKEYGEDLQVFNTTYSAIDLAAYIQATKKEGQKVLIWGGSGGTFWGQRYLQIFPEQADGLVLEGIVPPEFSIGFQDEASEKVNRRIMELCTEDDFCSAKLPDPISTLTDLYIKLTGGHCSQLGLSVQELKNTFDYLAYYYPHHTTIPALVYRLDRCDEADKVALSHFYQKAFGGKGDESGKSFSQVLFFNETFSELWEHSMFADNDAFLAYLDGVYEEAIFATGKGYERNDYFLKWPVYSDVRDDKWAETEVPMLMLQGVIDPATPYDYAVTLADHFNNPRQHFVSFPYAPHNVANGTPLTTDGQVHCGQQLYTDFLIDPTGELDTTCVNQALPLDFEGAAFGNYFFGTPDYWENPETLADAKASVPQISPIMPHIERELGRRLRLACPEMARRFAER